jgi:hypothetical protein
MIHLSIQVAGLRGRTGTDSFEINVFQDLLVSVFMHSHPFSFSSVTFSSFWFLRSVFLGEDAIFMQISSLHSRSDHLVSIVLSNSSPSIIQFPSTYAAADPSNKPTFVTRLLVSRAAGNRSGWCLCASPSRCRRRLFCVLSWASWSLEFLDAVILLSCFSQGWRSWLGSCASTESHRPAQR